MPIFDDLPSIDQNIVFSDELSQIDKIETMLGDWQVTGPKDEVSNFLLALSQTIYRHPFWPHREIFQQGSLSTQDRCSQKFRGSGTGRGTAGRPRLLISGKMDVHPIFVQRENTQPQQGDNSPTGIKTVSIKIRFDLKLNLARYIQAQPLAKRRGVKLGKREGPPVLAIVPDLRPPEKERTIVFDTNVVIGGLSRSNFLKSRTQPEHLAEYFQQVERLLVDGIIRADSETSVAVRYSPYISLRKLEVFWEFSSESPIDDVDSTGARLEQVSSDVSTRTIDLGGVTSDTRGMSRRYAVDLGNQARLRFYPKTTRRVRFEVVHNATSLSSIIGQRTSTEANSSNVLKNWVSEAISQSIRRTAPTLNRLNLAKRPTRGLLPPHRLVHALCINVPDKSVSSAILDALVREGCVRLNDLNPFTDEVRLLAKRRVLVPTQGKPRTWRVAPSYENALRLLREGTA
jgi:hypothetical protein